MNAKKNALFQCKKKLRESKTAIMQILMFEAPSGE